MADAQCGGIGGIFGGCDSSLLFFFLLLVVIFCNCGAFGGYGRC
ncbi:hypothetical protein [Crassaminicella profunda]|jgi:hypothetical protein|nr:hypothetical protein [Crassaminicella profunda]